MLNNNENHGVVKEVVEIIRINKNKKIKWKCEFII